MPLILTQSQVREVDRIAIEQFGMPGIALMENAGRGCAELLLAQKPSGPVTIVTGKGNNAGDGFVIARVLHNRGIDVRIQLLCPAEQFPYDAFTNWQIAQKMQIPFVVTDSLQKLTDNSWIEQSDWIVDAILGTGLQGDVRDPIRTAIARINSAQIAGTKVLAVDLPSGLHCDSGKILGEAIQADLTATFVALKPGFGFNQGPTRSGKISIIDIGAPWKAIEQALQS